MQELLSEAASFANEAYFTAATVQHAVLGLQIGNAIAPTRDEYFISAVENYAEIYKVFNKHKVSMGEALFKASNTLRKASG